MDLIMEQFELDMDILHSKYERVNEDLEFLIRKCDMKYIAESGTEDDLTALYTEANEQANEKKKNIFQKMLERIKAFIQKIISKIKGKKDKIEDDKEYEVDDVSAQLSESKRLSSELKNAINSKKPEKISAINSKIKKLMIALGIGAGVVATTTVILKKKKMRGSELKRTVNEVEKVIVDQEAEIKRISNMIDNLTDLDGVKEIQDAMANLTHVNSELVNKLTNKQHEIIDEELKRKGDGRTERELNIKEKEAILTKEKEKETEEKNKTTEFIKKEIELIEFTLKELKKKQDGIYSDKINAVSSKLLDSEQRAYKINKLSDENDKLILDILYLDGVKKSIERLLYIPALKIVSVNDIYKVSKLDRNHYVEKYRKNKGD